MHKYKNIIEDVGEMYIYALGQSCADIDKTIGYIRKIVIKIPSIVEEKMKKVNENRKRIEKYLQS